MNDLSSDAKIRREAAGSSALTPVEWALCYHGRGWSVVPVAPRSKNPIGEGWQKRELTAEDLMREFPDPERNIGVKPGDVSGGLVDIDLDCAEAVELAADYLPPTGAIFGRVGKPRSHYLYYAAGLRMKRYSDPQKTGGKPTLIELRANSAKGEAGLHTVFPGSIHPSGELVEWDRPWSDKTQPASVSDRLLVKCVEHLAAATLLVRAMPDGARHDYRLVIAGWLLRSGWAVDDVKEFMMPITRWTKGPDAEREVDGLVNNVEGKDLPGFPRLVEVLGEPRAKAVAKCLGIKGRACWRGLAPVCRRAGMAAQAQARQDRAAAP